MSRAKGNAAAGWIAAYLRNWWPDAEKTPNGRPGADIENTPGVAWEIKTGTTWRSEWIAQASRNSAGQLAPVIYLPPGLGERSVAQAHAVVPLQVFMQLLIQAGWAPMPADPAKVDMSLFQEMQG